MPSELHNPFVLPPIQTCLLISAFIDVLYRSSGATLSKVVFGNCNSATGAPLVQISDCRSVDDKINLMEVEFRSNWRNGGPMGIKISSGCHVQVENSLFDSNTGAAMDIANGTNVMIRNSTFKDNLSLSNGTIHALGANVTIENCNFINNTAGHSGGAVFTEVTRFWVMGSSIEKSVLTLPCRLPLYTLLIYLPNLR